MGEGWLLTAEILELIEDDAPNVVLYSPFGCLPNHVIGKAVTKEITKRHPEANIVAVDYDPAASEINQINRIKLMCNIAKERCKDSTLQKDLEPTSLSENDVIRTRNQSFSTAYAIPHQTMQ